MNFQEDQFVHYWKKIRRWHYYPYLTYEAIAFFFRKESGWRLMNFGYSSLNGEELVLPADEPQEERFALQLYYFVAGAVPLRGKELLEIGCGRGGGTSFIHRTMHPAKTTGMDFSRQVISFCRGNYHLNSLEFVVGNAMDLPFPDDHFDAVLNVESSHNYPERGQFYRQVFRVLRPDGFFLYSDVLQDHQYEGVAGQLQEAGFVIVDQTLINPEVMRAMERDNDRRIQEIERMVPSFFRQMARLFAGSTDSYPYRKLQSGKSRYFRIIAHKRP